MVSRATKPWSNNTERPQEKWGLLSIATVVETDPSFYAVIIILFTNRIIIIISEHKY